MTPTTPTPALADLDLDKLEALAIAAMPGTQIDQPDQCDAEAALQIALDPVVVRSLIALARRAAQPVAPVQVQPDDEEAKQRAIVEHLGPAALAGGKMSLYDAFGLAFDAGAKHARAGSPSPQIAEVAELPSIDEDEIAIPADMTEAEYWRRRAKAASCLAKIRGKQLDDLKERDAIAASRRGGGEVWTKDRITELSRSIAVAVAKNASTAPQLCFPDIYLGLTEALATPAPASAGQASPADARSYREEEFLTAARVALVALAHAAEKHGIYQTDHDRFAAAVEKFAAQPAEGAGQAGQVAKPELTVWYGSLPESNGKSNFTAILMRKGDDHFDNLTNGITIAQSEYPDRVRYEADRMRYLIGERRNKPWILDYDDEKHSGYAAPTERAAAPAEHKRVIEFALELAEHENDDAAVSFLKAWNSEDAGYLRANWPDFATHQPSAQVKP